MKVLARHASKKPDAMRLAVISLVPTPYREPLYRDLSRTPEWTTRIFYMQAQDSVRGWSALRSSYDAVQLRCLTPEALYPVPVIGVLNPGLIGRLHQFDPDCLLIHGYSYWPQMQAIRWAIRSGKPYLLCADSNAEKLGAKGPVAMLKTVWLRHCCGHAAGVLSIGSSNEAFWSHYGVGAERQFRSPLAVDNDFFASEAEGHRPQKTKLRQDFGLPDGRLLLYVGRLAPEKNLEDLLRALAVCAHDGRFGLALVGDGPSRPRITRLIEKLSLRNVFQFGFQGQSQLPKFYAMADALILPSRYEQWGLVVNEAMASGLPVLLSRRVGCAADLLEEGGNGFSFDPRDVASIAACLKRFSQTGDEELLRMGARSSQLIRRWSYREALAGILRALQAAAGARPGDRQALPAVLRVS